MNKIKKQIETLLSLGVATIVLSVPIYLCLKAIFCEKCWGLECAFCDLKAVFIAIAVFLFGLILLINSLLNLKKIKKNPSAIEKDIVKKILSTTAKWFIAIVLATVVILYTF